MDNRDNRIAELREARNWSLADLAREAKTTPAQIQKLERGDRRLTIDWMRRLAGALGVKPSVLLLDDDLEIPRLQAMEAALMAELRAAPEIDPQLLLNAARAVARVVRHACARQAMHDKIEGEGILVDNLADAWSQLSEPQRRRAVELVRLVVDIPARAAQAAA